MPKDRGWKEREPVPTPVFINLQTIANRTKEKEFKAGSPITSGTKSEKDVDELPVRQSMEHSKPVSVSIPEGMDPDERVTLGSGYTTTRGGDD